jgi:hypothetical protein
LIGGQALHHRPLPHEVRFGSPLSWLPNDLFISFKLAEKCERISIKADSPGEYIIVSMYVSSRFSNQCSLFAQITNWLIPLKRYQSLIYKPLKYIGAT